MNKTAENVEKYKERMKDLLERMTKCINDNCLESAMAIAVELERLANCIAWELSNSIWYKNVNQF